MPGEVRPERANGKRWKSERPIPATRAEADAIYRPSRSARGKRVNGFRLAKADELGLLMIAPSPRAPIDPLSLHEALLDATYPVVSQSSDSQPSP